jgi:hypothetical protein
VFAANSTTLLLRPNGASVSSGQLSIDTSGNANAEGIIGTSASSMRVTNTNGGFLIYKDATPTGAARFTYNTAAANTISLGVYDGASWTDPFRVTTTQALVTTTTASTGTSSGALVVSGGVGVAGAIVTGGIVRCGGSNGLSLGSDTGNIRIDTAGPAGVEFRGLSSADTVTGFTMREMALIDGTTAPSTRAGYATIYVDTADGDLKVKFGDGTVKTIATDS